MKNKVNNSIGLKYYRYHPIHGYLEIIRILKYYNENQLAVLRYDHVTDIWEKQIITKDELDTYMKLNSDGLVIFNIVNLGNSEDVMVSLHRRGDIGNKKIFPYMVCRQNIKDIFDYTINNDWSKTSLGVCVSEDTIPQGYDYPSLFKCTSVIETQPVNVYIDDDLRTILKFVKQTNMNSTLEKLKKEFESLEHFNTSGACTTVKELLELNDFMTEFDRGYNIIKLDTSLHKTLDTHCLDLESLKQFADKTSIYINPQNTFIVEYDKTINLSKIEEDHALLRDKNDKLYVMLYNNSTDVLPDFAKYNMDILQHYKLAGVEQYIK